MSILYFVLAAVALGVLVFIHELGHYFVAKWMGMRVEVFSIGFGKAIAKWQVGDVRWQLGWLPFGGYVKIKGMEVSKKEDKSYEDPYSIPDGFFGKSPWRRIAVALAGPVANFLLAFILFCVIWMSGGREKPFSEFTQIIGWVDPASEAYSAGIRPGDLITSYDGRPYKSTKDLLYAAMLSDTQVELEGYHVDYSDDQKTPFSVTIAPYPVATGIEGVRTTGLAASARYLVYDPESTGAAFPEGSPMEASGIKSGDRLVWADGEILFSLQQLSAIVNSRHALLTVERDGKRFLSRQPRVLSQDLFLSSSVRNELIDRKFESGIQGHIRELWTLPYSTSSDNKVLHSLSLLDEDQDAFFNADLPLQAGDQIVAVDGRSVLNGVELTKALQRRQVQLIVKRNVPLTANVSWKVEDEQFETSLDVATINALAAKVGTTKDVLEEKGYALLAPVTPQPTAAFASSPEQRAKLQALLEQQREKINEIKDPKKREVALDLLERNQELLRLGIPLFDRTVDYNPGPLALFGAVYTETWQTLKALIFGYLHPRWLSGPIGIVQVIHHGWSVGLGEALFWIAAISMNLGILNLLPIPVLDGGYILLSLWELITKKRISPKTMERLIIPFVILLIALLIFLTFQDLSRFWSS